MGFPVEFLQPDDPQFDAVADLISVLDLVPADVTDPDAVGAAGHPVVNSLGDRDEVFYGRSQPMASGRVFGGQVVAQAVIAAGRSVRDMPGAPRHLHSLHGYFLRAGDAQEPIQFAVQRLHDGGSFSTRRVHAIQYGRAILSMIFSFQVDSDGWDHQISMPLTCAPEDLPSLAEVLAHDDFLAKRFRANRPIDIRHCQGEIYLTEREPSTTQHVWLRSTGPLPDDRLLDCALLAYCSDYSLLEVALRSHGVSWSRPGLRAASLDHSMWFHRPASLNDWILYAEVSPSTQGGRGLGIGHLYTREGALVATVAQEGMIRVKPEKGQP